MTLFSWLPNLEPIKNYSGNWDTYENALYAIYTQDFIKNKPRYCGKPLVIYKEPMFKNKEATFWHIIQEDDYKTGSRIPSMERCERIRWPKPIIEKCPLPGCIKTWENIRRRKKRLFIWFNDEYLIVLEIRTHYKIFLTSYPTLSEHRKRKLQNEFESF